MKVVKRYDLYWQKFEEKFEGGKNNKYLYLSENRHKLMVLILHNKMCLHRKSFNSEANISNISQIFHVLLNRNIWKYEIYNIKIFIYKNIRLQRANNDIPN